MVLVIHLWLDNILTVFFIHVLIENLSHLQIFSDGDSSTIVIF